MPVHITPEERSAEVRRLVLAAATDLGMYGLNASSDSIAALASLVVNAADLGAATEADRVARLTSALDAATRRAEAAEAEAKRLRDVLSPPIGSFSYTYGPKPEPTDLSPENAEKIRAALAPSRAVPTEDRT